MTPKGEKERSDTTPSRLPDVQPNPQLGDYSVHTIQSVLEMQRTLGGVEKAINNLEEKAKEHGTKLDSLGKDVHAAKVVFYIVGGLILGMASLIAWLVNTYMATHPAK